MPARIWPLSCCFQAARSSRCCCGSSAIDSSTKLDSYVCPKSVAIAGYKAWHPGSERLKVSLSAPRKRQVSPVRVGASWTLPSDGFQEDLARAEDSQLTIRLSISRDSGRGHTRMIKVSARLRDGAGAMGYRSARFRCCAASFICLKICSARLSLPRLRASISSPPPSCRPSSIPSHWRRVGAPSRFRA
jgi:hypothetical protein